MKFRLLRADEIDVKVKQVTEKGAIALLYKTARTDMAILDETFGVMNWTDDYKETKGNLYCGIGVREAEEKPFIWKWDCGIESREDDEGNQKKGEASDAFKRAGSKLGIGRELYTAPFIFLTVNTKKQQKDGKDLLKNGKPVYILDDKFQTFYVSEIEYDDNRNIKLLEICDDNDSVVYSYGKRPNKAVKSSNSENIKEDADLERIDILTVEEAKNFEFTLKGKVYKVGECSNEQLFWLRDNAKDKLLEATELVLANKAFTGDIT